MTSSAVRSVSADVQMRGLLLVLTEAPDEFNHFRKRAKCLRRKLSRKIDRSPVTGLCVVGELLEFDFELAVGIVHRGREN